MCEQSADNPHSRRQSFSPCARSRKSSEMSEDERLAEDEALFCNKSALSKRAKIFDGKTEASSREHAGMQGVNATPTKSTCNTLEGTESDKSAPYSVDPSPDVKGRDMLCSEELNHDSLQERESREGSTELASTVRMKREAKQERKQSYFYSQSLQFSESSKTQHASSLDRRQKLSISDQASVCPSERDPSLTFS